MLRYLAFLAALSFGACVPPGPSSDIEGAGADSSTVGATLPGVPDDRPVVVFLGTSLTAGLGLLRGEDTYVARVSELASAAGTPIRAVNAGVSGETSAGGLRRLDWILREPLDVLVLELGANDGLRGQDPRALADNLAEIVRRTRTRYPDTPVIIAGMEALPILGPLYTTAFRAVFPTVAAQVDALLIPFLLDGVAGVPELNQGDFIHPTAEGHELIAASVWTVLAPVVANLAGGGP